VPPSLPCSSGDDEGVGRSQPELEQGRAASFLTRWPSSAPPPLLLPNPRHAGA
jgi:hypothetical protein